MSEAVSKLAAAKSAGYNPHAMSQLRRVVVLSFAIAGVAIACSGPSAPKAPDSTANVDVPVSSASASSTAGAPTRPDASATIAECQSDADCVPASCCHPTACVPAGSKPSCEGAICTRDCKGGTLDCGGSCGCEAKKCVAHVRQRNPQH